MSRLSFFFTTLIAAVPAAFLGYLCVMAFLLHSENLPAMLMIVAGITLLLCVAVIAMPAAVLLKSHGAAKPAAETEDKAVEEASADEVAAEEAEVEEPAVVASNDKDVFVEGKAEEFEGFEDESRSK